MSSANAASSSDAAALDHPRPMQPHGAAALDQHQRAVVAAQHQSILVRSCAGSGKSTTLAVRAGALIAQGVPADDIVLLTFSVRSKLDLEQKLQRLLPSSSALPAVWTHHAKALQILRAAGCTSRVIEAGAQGT